MAYQREKLPEVEAPDTEGWRTDLLKAADTIRKFGLAKGALCNSDGVCVRGAMLNALNGTPYGDVWNGEFRALEHRLNAWLGFRDQVLAGQSELVFWNNAPERTEGEVITALERAAYGP